MDDRSINRNTEAINRLAEAIESMNDTIENIVSVSFNPPPGGGGSGPAWGDILGNAADFIRNMKKG